MSESESKSLVHPSDEQHRAQRQLAEAKKFLSEQKLASWVQFENQSKGVAPTPGAVMTRLLAQLGRAASAAAAGASGSRRGGRKCTFGLGDRSPAAAFEHKAGDHFHRFQYFSGPHFWGQKAGTGLRPFLFVSFCRCPKWGPIAGPVFGYQNVVHQRSELSHSSGGEASVWQCLSVEVTACWHWVNFVAACNDDGKPILRVNLDETSLKLHVPPRPGLVFAMPEASATACSTRSGA